MARSKLLAQSSGQIIEQLVQEWKFGTATKVVSSISAGDYSDFASVLAAAANLDAVELDSGTWTSNGLWTLDSLTIKGKSRLSTLLVSSSGDWTLGIGTGLKAEVEGIGISNSKTGGPVNTAAFVTGQSVFKDCDFTVTLGSSTLRRAAYVFDCEVIFDECNFLVANSAANTGVLAEGASAIVTIVGGTILAAAGTAYAVSAMDNAIIRLDGPRIISGDINSGTGGIVTGWYYNSSDEKVYLGDINVEQDVVALGNISTASGTVSGNYLESTMPDGMPGMGITSTTLIPNLNADMLDGYHVSSLQNVVYGLTKTVNAAGGADFTTIAAALDWFRGKVPRNCIISLAAGSYSETVNNYNIATSKYDDLMVRGDTRAIVGLSYVHNEPGNRGGVANAGATNGAVTLSVAGNNITVAVAGGNPNFATAGIVAGDTLVCRQTAGSFVNRTVQSVSGNVITCTVAAPTVAGNGGAITINPNVMVSAGSGGIWDIYAPITLRGMKIVANGSPYTAITIGGTREKVYGLNLVIQGGAYGINVSNGGYFESGNNPITFVNHQTIAALCQHGSGMAINCAIALHGVGVGIGFYALLQSYMQTWRCLVAGGSSGFASYHNSMMYAPEAGAIVTGTAFAASNASYIYATGVNAYTNGKGNTTNYTPATSDTVGNIGSYITWS